MRRLVLLASATAALVLVPAAQAGPIIDRAVAALNSDPVYVDPAAELAPSVGRPGRLRRKIDSAGAGPVYIAILPAAAEQEAGGSPDGVLQAIHDALGRKGTYAAVIGRTTFAPAAMSCPRGQRAAWRPRRSPSIAAKGVTATLLDFVDRMAAERSGKRRRRWERRPTERRRHCRDRAAHRRSQSHSSLFRAIRKRRRSQAELAEVKAAAHEDLIALADDVQKLEQPVESNAQAKQEYTQALDFYDQASGAYDRVTQPRQLEAVTSALEEGRWHMSCGRVAPRRTQPARAAPTLLLRSAPRPFGTRRRVDASWRNAEKGSGLRSGRTRRWSAACSQRHAR